LRFGVQGSMFGVKGLGCPSDYSTSNWAAKRGGAMRWGGEDSARNSAGYTTGEQSGRYIENSLRNSARYTIGKQ
jgi:hypothetical protein